MNGKGDTPRNCFTEQYRENYDAIFRRKRKRRRFALNVTVYEQEMPFRVKIKRARE